MHQISANQLQHFHDQGYVTVPNFFSTEEVAALQAEVANLKAAGRLRNVIRDANSEVPSTKAFNLQICPIGMISPLIAALPWAEGISEVLRGLLRGDVVQHLDQIFLKPAHHGVGTNWHTDNSYFRSTDPRYGVGMWIAINDATVDNGTMRIIPKSHVREFDHVRDPASDHHITCAAVINESASIPIEVKAGGVLFFNYGIAHCTKANTTAADRAGLALHFVNGEHPPLQDHHFKDKPQSVWRWLSGPNNDGGKAWHGQDLRGVWASEVARTQAALTQ